ncbi:hypothetical protein HXX76_005495 [Chlamydomonas incerta]|uniref:Uncharacterized protein n=1 Tax=Chlamydomonas incerta TaxID=51695 RepID=A0A835W5B6_CHLIN|nr:hypothetical protein HXX76_005495 [Chlamydomonas incerta]|eukprot:KAG2437878.1 hypothetical protein HXX76_005495 [Chlamydomonas incerta]
MKRARSNDDIQPEIEKFTSEIEKVEEKIEKTEEKEEIAESAVNVNRSALWEEQQLRTKDQELRKEKKQLCKQKYQLGSLATPDEPGTAMMARLRKLNGTVPAPGEVLSFSATSGLLLDPKYHSVYIRDCYEPLFKELMSSKCKDIIITGTLGIGKSWFLYYMLAQLQALPEPPPYILWEHLADETEMWCYNHATGEVLVGTRTAFKDQLRERKAWYICDGVKPNYSVLARIILISSPSRPTYKVYDSSVSKSLAVQLYERFGGVARYVLGVPSQQDEANPAARLEELVQELTAALDTCTADKVRSGIGALAASGPEVSHRVLHIITKDNFKLSHLDFASRWVADAFVARSIKNDVSALVTLVASSSGAIRGHLHEQLMHRVLAQGGEFTIEPVNCTTLASDKAKREPWQLPTASEMRSFKDVDEIMAGSNSSLLKKTYFRPLHANFSTVDSLLHVGKTLHLFQMTVASSGKTVSAKALTKLYKSLNITGKHYTSLRLYYVVPPDVFKSFKLSADSGSWPPTEDQPDALRTKLYVLKGRTTA